MVNFSMTIPVMYTGGRGAVSTPRVLFIEITVSLYSTLIEKSHTRATAGSKGEYLIALYSLPESQLWSSSQFRSALAGLSVVRV